MSKFYNQALAIFFFDVNNHFFTYLALQDFPNLAVCRKGNN